MESKARIVSILETKTIDLSSLGFEPFYLSNLVIPNFPSIEIKEKIRLGHRVEKIVGYLIKASTNYKIHSENLQIKEGKKTIGELDFIIEEVQTKKLIHLELAYKFYLFDPSLSSIQIKNWIGPNRNDSLIEKTEKLQEKQFPLLYHPQTKAMLTGVNITNIEQHLCLLTSLYIPFENKVPLNPEFQNAVKGYYLKYTLFKTLKNKDNYFYVPPKKDWGINPKSNKDWFCFEAIESDINMAIKENQAVLCWQKTQNTYSEFFIVWW